ncbi:hypothetical protein TIFTF001_002745 [Ficus carica]|uniref:Uncharacterized protein n=1 Tax=Ficus carica TaxID=3494 RepID=A0AA87Z637_FICCA|nr:hypothetical protein TIFTF001_002745 [Ficus carica]
MTSASSPHRRISTLMIVGGGKGASMISASGITITEEGAGTVNLKKFTREVGPTF